MSQENVYKSEDKRITDLEHLVVTFQDRFDRIERMMTQGGGWPGLEPITLYPVYMPGKGEPVGEPIRDDTATACFEDITTPIDGERVYRTVGADDPCPEPTPAQKAQAAIEARKNLLAFATTWCREGAGACATPNGCTPVLSGIKVTTYTPGSRATDDGRKACFVTASITGTVSCRCT
jgi:hypothetical protein